MGLWHGLIEARRGEALGAGDLLRRYLEKDNHMTRQLFCI